MIMSDNAHVLQTRLILLDAPLILFMVMSFYAYIRFYKLRYSCVSPLFNIHLVQEDADGAL